MTDEKKDTAAETTTVDPAPAAPQSPAGEPTKQEQLQFEAVVVHRRSHAAKKPAKSKTTKKARHSEDDVTEADLKDVRLSAKERLGAIGMILKEVRKEFRRAVKNRDAEHLADVGKMFNEAIRMC